MYSSTVIDPYAAPAPYAQASVLKENSSQPASSAQNSEESSPNPKPLAGDSVTISQEARVAAEHKTEETVPVSPTTQETPVAKKPSYSSIKTVTTSDRTEVNFEASYTKDKNGHRQTSSIRVNFTDTSGESYSHTLNESSILTQDEKGRWQVSQIQGNSITGSENDDIIIILPTGKSAENNTNFEVNAAEGDNVVMDFSGKKTHITAGSGNDTIIGASRKGSYVVNSGDGDDTIELRGSVAYVESGDGNDSVTFEDIIAESTHTGGGNDSINFKYRALVGNIVDGGDGDDYINFEYGASNTILSGNGNDTITFAKDKSNAYIDGGDGDDYIKGNMTGTICHIQGGDGKDSINIRNTGGKCFIQDGDGDGYIQTENTGGTTYVNGGNGDDKILSQSSGGTVYTTGGNGNDTIVAAITGGTNYISGGNGNDVIVAGTLGGKSYITGGAGNDYIYAYSENKVNNYATIIGGSGFDVILVNDHSKNLEPDEINKIIQEAKIQKSKKQQVINKDIFNYDQYIADAAMGLNKKSKTKTLSNDEQYIQENMLAQYEHTQRRQALAAYGKQI